MDTSGVTLSEHAKQRYAERIMGRETKGDVVQYVANNQEKIKTDILKMVEFGKVVYHGVARTNKTVHLIVSGTWILILSEDKNVITLFKKDLGVDDEEFNKMYMKRMIDKLAELTDLAKTADDRSLNEMTAFREKVKSNEEEIQSLRNRIKGLENLNENYRGIITNLSTESQVSWDKVKDYLNRVLGSKEF